MNAKVDERRFGEVKLYLKSHSNKEACTHFNLSLGTVAGIKRYGTYNEWRESTAKARRESYAIRKAGLYKKDLKGNGIHFTPPSKPIDGTANRTVNGGPFGKAVVPRPIVPLGARLTAPQDGKIITKQVEPQEILPMTLDQYRKAYEDQKVEIGKLNGKLAKAEMDLKKKIEDYDALKTLYDNLLGGYRRKSEALEKINQPIKPLGNVVSMPENTDMSTEIEITVGEAVVKITTKGSK